MGWNCIAREGCSWLDLYCKRKIVLQENACGWKIVLQYGGAVG